MITVIRLLLKNPTICPGLEVIKLEFFLRIKIKHYDWLPADVSAGSQSLYIILSLRKNSSFITCRPDDEEDNIAT